MENKKSFKHAQLVIFSVLFIFIINIIVLRFMPTSFVKLFNLFQIKLESRDLATKFMVGTVARLLGTVVVIYAMIRFDVIKFIKFNWNRKYLLISWLFIVYIFLNMDLALIGPNKILLLVLMLASNLAIGIFEEVLTRGFILNVFLKRYGESKKGIYYSVLVSSIIFGISHLMNLFTKNVAVNEVISQVFYATFIGVVFGAIYIRTGYGLWWCVLLHAMYDAADELSLVAHYQPVKVIVSHVHKVSNMDAIVNAALMLPLLIYGLYLLRNVNSIKDL
jgi:membrane protease YdiL (CAAX protease family)